MISVQHDDRGKRTVVSSWRYSTGKQERGVSRSKVDRTFASFPWTSSGYPSEGVSIFGLPYYAPTRLRHRDRTSLDREGEKERERGPFGSIGRGFIDSRNRVPKKRNVAPLAPLMHAACNYLALRTSTLVAVYFLLLTRNEVARPNIRTSLCILFLALVMKLFEQLPSIDILCVSHGTFWNIVSIVMSLSRLSSLCVIWKQIRDVCKNYKIFMKVYCKHALDKKLVYGISDRLKRTISAKHDFVNIETTVDEIWKDKPVSKWKMY